MSIKEGDKIKVDYTGELEDGTVFDSSEKHGAPLEFVVGEGKIIKGFDSGVIGMKKDEEKELKIPPTEAYGELNDEMVKTVPKEQLPPDQTPEVGMVLGLKLPSGQTFPAKVVEVNEKEVKIDLNHPLAGKSLIFKIKIVDIESKKSE